MEFGQASRWRAVVALATIAIGGCGSRDEGKITTASSTVQMREYRIAPQPLAVMGGAKESADFDLTHVSRVIPGSDGGYLVYREESPYFLVFQADGSPVRAFGVEGNGPNEFRLPKSVLPTRGDTVVALDLANARVSWITPAAGVVKQTPVTVNETLAMANDVGRFGDGSLVALLQHGPADSKVTGKRRRAPLDVLISAVDGGPSTTVITVDGIEYALSEGDKNATILGAVNFSGQPVVAIVDSLIAVASGTTHEVRLYTRAGALVRTIHWEGPRRPVTEAAKKTVPGPPPRLAAVTPPPIFADSLPTVSAVFPISGGRLWVADWWMPGDTTWSATLLSTDGAVLGRLTIRSSGAPVAIDDDRVLISTQDEDGIVALTAYRLEM